MTSAAAVREDARLWLFPATYLVHIAEEAWAGEGFARWWSARTGGSLTTAELVVLNGAGWIGMVGLVALARAREETFASIAALLAAVVVANGLLHVGFSVATRDYTPGLASGLALWLPLGAATWSRIRPRLGRTARRAALAAAVAVQAGALLLARLV